MLILCPIAVALLAAFPGIALGLPSVTTRHATHGIPVGTNGDLRYPASRVDPRRIRVGFPAALAGKALQRRWLGHESE